MSEAYLILENGAVFKGQAFGYPAETVGELVFSTGMVDYLETLTNPCYSGQIVLQTFPLSGNYGVISADFESDRVHLKAYIVREWCQEPSNFRCEGELDTFLKRNKIPGLCGIDTRALTRILRENGVMNAMISQKPEITETERAKLREYRITNAVESVQGSIAAAAIGVIGGDTQKPRYKIALWDFGVSKSFLHNAITNGFDTEIFPYDTTAETILAAKPDGIILSEGPGDPAQNVRIIDEIKKLHDKKIPIFAVGLGHQMLALAMGAKTEKLHFGHRGANQPVKDTGTGRVFVTTQNHGYAVEPGSLPKSAEMIYVNCNDNTCEGISYGKIPALSVQFCPGDDADARIYDRFISMLERGEGNAAE